jgi:hypothetical protein
MTRELARVINLLFKSNFQQYFTNNLEKLRFSSIFYKY